MRAVRRHIARQGHRFGRPSQSSFVVLPDQRQNEEREDIRGFHGPPNAHERSPHDLSCREKHIMKGLTMQSQIGLLRTAATLALLTAALHGEVKVLKNCTLIDGSGRPPLKDAALIVDNGRIQWVGPSTQLKTPASAETIDLKGKYVMPGIINLHGHIGNTAGLKQDASFFTRESIENNLKTYARYGVTTVLSMGTDQDLIFKVRDEERSGRPSMARVYTAGQGFVYKGGYGGLAGVNPGVATVAEVEPAVAALAAMKVDVIKLWLDDHLHTQKKMPYDIAKAIIDSAHRHQLPAVAHIFYLRAATK